MYTKHKLFSNMHNNNNDVDNAKFNSNIWGISNVDMQQQQSLQLPQQQRITNWIADTNKSQQQQLQHFNQNNNDNDNKFSNCNNLMQQQQLQQNYEQQQYNSYRHNEPSQRNAVAATTTTLPSINYYGYQQQHHLQQQQQQQQPHAQQLAQPALFSPYAVATTQQQQAQHLQQQQQQQQQQHQQQRQLIPMDELPQYVNCSATYTNIRTPSACMQCENESFNDIYPAGFDIPPLASFQSAPAAYPAYCNGAIKAVIEEDSQASFTTTDDSSVTTADYIANGNISNAKRYTSLTSSATSSQNNTDILTIGQTVNTPNCMILSNNETITGLNRGCRRPVKYSQNTLPKEEEKRRIRRERNKLAAARCRQRRVDQTQNLLQEVKRLERIRSALHKAVEKLNSRKITYISWMEEHYRHCPLLRHSYRNSGER